MCRNNCENVVFVFVSRFILIHACFTRLQLSYSSASPKLSDKNTYKRFFRVFPAESSFNPAKFDLLDTYKWKKVGTLHQAKDIFSEVGSYYTRQSARYRAFWNECINPWRPQEHFLEGRMGKTMDPLACQRHCMLCLLSVLTWVVKRCHTRCCGSLFW